MKLGTHIVNPSDAGSRFPPLEIVLLAGLRVNFFWLFLVRPVSVFASMICNDVFVLSIEMK